MECVDSEAEAMREQRHLARLNEGSKVVSESSIVAERQVGLLLRMAIVQKLGHHAILQIARLRRHIDVTHRSLEAAAGRTERPEDVVDELQEP